jgi:antirestriction protein
MSIDNSEDMLDSRDIIARIAELEATMPENYGAGADVDTDDLAELTALHKLAAQCESLDDWEHGLGLVRDSYFVTYAQELAEDTGSLPCRSKLQWPNYCIDWEYAARELQHDYSSVDFDGVTYWVR